MQLISNFRITSNKLSIQVLLSNPSQGQARQPSPSQEEHNGRVQEWNQDGDQRATPSWYFWPLCLPKSRKVVEKCGQDARKCGKKHHHTSWGGSSWDHVENLSTACPVGEGGEGKGHGRVWHSPGWVACGASWQLPQHFPVGRNVRIEHVWGETREGGVGVPGSWSLPWIYGRDLGLQVHSKDSFWGREEQPLGLQHPLPWRYPWPESSVRIQPLLLLQDLPLPPALWTTQAVPEVFPLSHGAAIAVQEVQPTWPCSALVWAEQKK